MYISKLEENIVLMDDLTSMYISKLEENIVLMDNKNRYIAAEAEKAREEMVTESKEQDNLKKKEVARLKKEVDDLVYNEASFKDNDEKVLFFYWFEHLGTVSCFVLVCQTSTETAFYFNPLSAANDNSDETASWSQWPGPCLSF